MFHFQKQNRWYAVFYDSMKFQKLDMKKQKTD